MPKAHRRDVFRKDRRRKHHHWAVTLFYSDGEKFERVYVDLKKARCFAERQRKSPVVQSARVRRLS